MVNKKSIMKLPISKVFDIMRKQGLSIIEIPISTGHIRIDAIERRITGSNIVKV